MLSHNEQEAMSATELQAKISELLHSNPDIVEAVRSVHITCVKSCCCFCTEYVPITSANEIMFYLAFVYLSVMGVDVILCWG